MSKVTIKNLDRSYQLMGLLAVCAHAASTINECSNVAPAQIASGLANCLELALGLVEEQHDLLEVIHRDQGRPE